MYVHQYWLGSTRSRGILATRSGLTDRLPAPTHAFDAGAAWGYLALQASLSGWAMHAMAGIEHERPSRSDAQHATPASIV